MAEVKKECFAWMPTNNRCGVLTETICKNKEVCNFYKTKQQFKEDLAKAERRV